MANKDKKLTTRQWVLYNILLDNFPNKLSLEEIHAKMSEYYPPITKAKMFTNSIARRLLTDDLTALESLDPIQLIIVRSSGGIGIATSKEEAEKYIETNKISLLEALKRYWRQKRKLNNHNQMKLVFNKEKEYCRAFIEQEKDVANG